MATQKKYEEKKLHIAMLGHKRIPSREGGIEVVVEELSTRMAKAGHQVTCFNRAGHHVSGKEFEAEEVKQYKGVRVCTVPTLDKSGLAAMTSSLTASIAVAFGKYDVAHFHAEGPCAMMWLPKLFGKRCVATIHGLDHKCPKWGKFAKTYIMFGEKMAAKLADEVIVLSKGVQDYFKDTYGRKTVLIPNGVNAVENIEPQLIEKQFGLKRNSYILFLGRIVYGKGIEYLIKAYKQLDTDKKLVIAGGTSDSQEFMNKLKEMAADDERIVFTGFVQGQILEELYSNAYIYTLPSDSEGMPLSLLEAMSYGNCCLVSDIAECADVVEEKGVVFRKGDVQDLRGKLQMLLNEENITSLYKKDAAEFIVKKYNWDEVVEKTIQLYRQ